VTDATCDDASTIAARARMVSTQLRARGLVDETVLAAMGAVPRHAFVPPDRVGRAYDDGPLPIGHGATISQPYIVAYTLEAAAVRSGQRVLDVGTGCGYQAAVLAALGAEVYGIELEPALAREAGARLAALGHRVDVVAGDGTHGRPEHAPYDAIVVAAAAPHVPDALVRQLRDGGRLVIPVGPPGGGQVLELVERAGDRTRTRNLLPVRFVPMRGEAQV
jgi:protein-L-isoaspartate(D-aspartate) O-methyltransferase